MIDILLASSLGSAMMQNFPPPYTPETEPPMAYFDVVPQQDVTGVFNVGVVAYHLEDVDRVQFTITREGYIGDWNADETVDGDDLSILLERWRAGVEGRDLARLLGAWGTATPHHAEYVTVTEMTLNPRTNEMEYWFPLDTRSHPDTKITVTAEVFGTMGPSVVLDRDVYDENYLMPQYSGVNLFSTNVGNKWPTRELYISPDGDDVNGDGTRENPLRGLHDALRYGLQQPYAEIGGTTVYLLEGEHTIDASGGWPLNSFRQSNGRYFTITPAPGVASADCKIVANENTSGGGGFLTKSLCRFKDVFVETDQERILNGGTKRYGGRWYDGCIIKGHDYSQDQNAMFVTGKGGFQWWTDTLHTWTQEGTTGLIMRNCVLDSVSCDALELHYAQLLLNIEITNHNPMGDDDPTGCHIDYMQYNAIEYVHQNTILRDIYANHTCREQGVHACPGEGVGGAIHNSAWVNVQLSNQGGNGIPECSPTALIWRWCGPAKNNLFKDCILVQKQSNLPDRHSTFTFDRNNPDGSRNEDGPWTWNDVWGWKYVNVKIEDCFEDWDKTQPWFPSPTAGASWTFYGPDELMWNSNMNFNDVFENSFGPDDPWKCPITGVYFTQTE
tara:strand:+ start:10544 stop:12385 length:1842 start_codon:yes stop_codon:yes gene_type:complete